MDDQALLDGFFRRDENALARTAARYGGYCYRVALNILSSHEDAEECVNDTWQRAWDAIPPERPADFKAWLAKVTRNLSLNRIDYEHAQKRNRKLNLIFHELEDVLPSGQNTEQDLLAGELTTAIDRWLRTLTREDRFIFIRRYWYAESLSTIASTTGATDRQLAQRLFRLRKKLKTTLEQEGFTP